MVVGGSHTQRGRRVVGRRHPAGALVPGRGAGAPADTPRAEGGRDRTGSPAAGGNGGVPEGRTVVDLRVPEQPVVIIGADRAFEQRVRTVLARPSNGGVLRWDKPLNSAADVKVVADRSPAAVILGHDLPKATAFNLAAHFECLNPAISVLVVAVPTPDIWRRALSAGTRALVCPDASDDELRAHLSQALEVSRRRLEAEAATAGEPAHGRVVTVISPKGGSGKTIVSANLAVGLARRAPGDVVLLDLDAAFGDVSYALGVTPAHTVADAVSAVDQLDATMLKGFLTRHESGLYALCAPDRLTAGEVIPATALSTVIGLLASQFGHLVIDTAGGLSEHTLAALDLSTDVVLIAGMDVASVRDLRKTLDALDALGMRSPTRHLVLNRSNSRVRIDKEAVAAVAGLSIAVEVPSSRDVPLSLNEGRPLVLGKPRSPAGRGLADLVERIISTSGDGTRGGRGGHLWEFMFGLMERFVEREGHALVPVGHHERGLSLGRWVAGQRRANRRGDLDFDRVRRLSALVGWSWNPLTDEASAEAAAAEVPVGEYGHARASTADRVGRVETEGWIAGQPDLGNGGLPSAIPAAGAEALPGWSGDPADDKPPANEWEQGFDRLVAFTKREGHVPVPFDDGRGGTLLDRWVVEQRRAYRLGYISPERVVRLQSLPGWSWDSDPSPWEDFFSALEQFAVREGHTSVSKSHREAGRELGRWVHAQRAAHRAGKMPPERVARLQALPGWDWGPRQPRR